MLELYLGQNPNTSEANPLKDDHCMSSYHRGGCIPDRGSAQPSAAQRLGMPSVGTFDPVSVREAMGHLRRALELDPDNPAPERMLKWVNILSIYYISTIIILTWCIPDLPAAQLLASDQDGTSCQGRLTRG